MVNLDGRTVAVSEYVQQQLDALTARGFVEVPVRGVVGCSDLGVHTRTACHTGIVAYVRNGYAYVVLHDGSMLDGVFHRFADGTFSVA